MYKLVLIRHGQSAWNLENRFTGWTDVDLTDQGREEAKAAAEVLKAEGFKFDAAYTSVLKRAIRTLWTVLDGLDQMYIPVNRTWRLNERHYGALQGANKAEATKEFGEEQVFTWRRSYDIPPEPLSVDDERHPSHDARYADVAAEDLPATESLATTIDRFLPIWHDEIAPMIKSGKKVIIAAHGNSLRALVKYLDDLTPEQIADVNIPTAVPLVYELDENLKPIKERYYLGDQEAIAAAAHAVANQAKGG